MFGPLGRRVARLSALPVALFLMAGPTIVSAAELSERETFTGDWGGRRASLIQAGLRLDSALVVDFASVVDGGLRRGGVFLSSLDVKALIDLERRLGWKGANVLVDVLHTAGPSVSARVGDAQGVDNIEAGAGLGLYEFWLQRVFWERRASVLVGLYDLNSEFDMTQTAGLFVNSSHGMGAEFAASGLVGPSTYPFTALGLRLKLLPRARTYVQFLITDGVPGNPHGEPRQDLHLDSRGGALLVGEAGLYRFEFRTTQADGGQTISSERAARKHVGREVPANYRFKVALGVWSYTSRFELFRPEGAVETGDADAGIYGLIDFRPEAEGPGWSAFARFGRSRSSSSRFDSYVGAGVVRQGVFAGRSEDRVGLSFAWAGNSDAFVRFAGLEPLAKGETVVELSLRWAVTPWCGIQPDVQRVIDPGSSKAVADAWFFALRNEIVF